jgi:hypothetical protein
MISRPTSALQRSRWTFVPPQPVTSGLPYSIRIQAHRLQRVGGGTADCYSAWSEPARLFQPDRIAVFRPATGEWVLRNDDGSPKLIVFPGPVGANDYPVPGDYDGKGRAQPAIYRAGSGEWLVRSDDGSLRRLPFNVAGGIPVPADYVTDGKIEPAVYRKSDGRWFIGSQSSILFGWPDAAPVAGDYSGDGRTEIAVFRPSTQEWRVRGDVPRFLTFSRTGDVPVPAVYDTSGRTGIALYRRSDSIWLLRQENGQAKAFTFGDRNAVPVPRDYLSLGYAQPATFHPDTGIWRIRGEPGVSDVSLTWGQKGDIPVPAAYLPNFGG